MAIKVVLLKTPHVLLMGSQVTENCSKETKHLKLAHQSFHTSDGQAHRFSYWPLFQLECRALLTRAEDAP